jgi:hypothetical protein
MNTCQVMIGVDVTFYQILDIILTQRSSLSLGKPERPPVIKNKPYESKNKEVKPSSE